MASKDFLDELIEESTKRNPEFPSMVDAAYERRRQARKAAAKEKKSEPAGAFRSERLEDEHR